MSRLVPSLTGLVVVVSSLVQPTTPRARDHNDRAAAEAAGEDRPSPAGKQGLPPEPGPFKRLLNEQKFLGPGIVAATDRTAAKYRLPGDFEPAEAILIVGGRLARDHPKLLAKIVTLVRRRTSVVCLVSTPRERSAVTSVLTSSGLAADAAGFVEVATNTIWVRDFGPIFVKRRDGARIAIDVEYEKTGRGQDNDATRAVADHFKTPTLYVPILLEGGGLLSNGQGLCVATTAAVNRNISRGYEPAAVTEYFQKHFGCRQLVLLEPLRDEITGHVDMFACFTDPETIVVGAYSKCVDPGNAALLDRNAALLAKVRTARGKLRVVRVPMPGNEDGLWRTYTNCLFASGLLLVPQYRRVDTAAQRNVLETFRSLLPGWDVVGVDADKLIAQEGALRCITVHVPPEAASPGKR